MWERFILRVKSKCSSVIGNSRDGLVIVHATIIIGYDGEPVVYVVDEPRRIEPSKDAKNIIGKLLPP